MDQHSAVTPSLTAADVMTAAVISVKPKTSVQEVARRLLEARVSAVPVVDEAGAPIGIVSEGDLLGRSEEDRQAGQEWWLSILSAPGHKAAAMIEAAVNGTPCHLASDVMHTPVVTVEAGMPVGAVAELLRSNGIKRAPVMRAGRMIGIVSRADLLRALEAEPRHDQKSGLIALIGSIFEGAGRTARIVPRPMPVEAPPVVTAGAFRQLMDGSVQGHMNERKAAEHTTELARIAEVKTMLHEHVGTEMWDRLLVQARVVAAHGGTEIELLRFPCGLCSDGGRKIGIADPAWAESLRGEAAEIHARWLQDLKPVGFGLAARVMDYPKGIPGDIALFLVWETA